MNYLNPLEWLIKTDYVYSGDPLYVVADSDEVLQDFVLDTGIADIGCTQYATEILTAIAHGRKLIIDGSYTSQNETEVLYKILSDMLTSSEKMRIRNRQIGVSRAAEQGHYKGRTRTPR